MSQSANAERITQAFARAKAESRVALIPYVMSGYPDLATSEAVAVALCKAGADVLELGVPFSDPLADGATIQYAAQRALDGGMTLSGALALAARVSAQVVTPLVLMGYYNPIFSYGVDRFMSRAAESGVAGLIIPDLPPEEAGDPQAAAARHGIALIFHADGAVVASALLNAVDAAPADQRTQAAVEFLHGLQARARIASRTTGS
jgi:tryptophan synthase alpha chain